MSSKGSKAEVTEVDKVFDTDSTEEAPVLDPADNPVFGCVIEGCDYETPDINELDTHAWGEHDCEVLANPDGTITYKQNVEPAENLVKSFPTQAGVKELKLRMDNVEGYALSHEEAIAALKVQAADIAQMKQDINSLRAEILQSAGYEALRRQIQLARHVIDSHVKAPHRAG